MWLNTKIRYCYLFIAIINLQSGISNKISTIIRNSNWFANNLVADKISNVVETMRYCT